MSAVTLNVNVPQTGHTDQELQDAYDSGYTSGYTSGETAGFNSGYTSGETDVISTFISTAVTENGVYGDSAHPLSSITVNVPQSGGGGVKYVEYIETNNTQIGWDTGYNIGTDIDARIYLDFMPLAGVGYGDYWYAYYGDGEDYVLFRRAGNSSSIGFLFGDNNSKKNSSSYYVTNGNMYLISLDKYGITDENTGTLLESANSSYINSTNNLWLNCNGNPQQVTRCIPARYYGFRVENGSGETALDMRPCLDENDVPCFYDEVSQTYIHHIGSGTPIAGPVLDPSYQSGYTDGQNSIISTFTATAVTTNGVYGNSAHPLSSITVNVPQSGSFSSITLTANTAITSSEGGYSAITVNVPQTGISPVFLADYVHATTLSASSSMNYLIDTGIYPTTGTTFRVKGMGKGKEQGNIIVGFYNNNDSKDYRLFWYWTSGSRLCFDFNAQRRENINWGGAYDGRIIDLTCSNYQVYDNISETVLLSGTQQTTMQDTSQTIKVDAGSWWLKSLEVYDENGNLVFDGQAAHDANGNGGLYDSISGNFKIPNGITLTYEPIADYASGFTDGYDTAFDDVESGAQTLSVTANGTYNTHLRADGYLWDEVVVNVPQTGYSINDLARRNYTIANPSITAITIEESAFGGCSGLTGNLELGSTVWFINKGAFCGSSISEIIWPQNIYGGPFSVTSMTMRNSLQFSECQNLEYVEVPNYVTFSGDSINASSGMFYNCQSLVNVDYYASRIPTHCFDGCIKLEYIYIDNITSIAQKAFYGCTHLTSIRFAQQNRPSVADYDAFTYVPSGGTLYVPFGRSSEYQPYLNFLTNWTIVEDAE